MKKPKTPKTISLSGMKYKVCSCFAHSEDECSCGAWHKKPEPSVTIRRLRKIAKELESRPKTMPKDWELGCSRGIEILTAAAKRAAKETKC